MDRPFREVHELYKILYQRAEAQAEADKERKEEEEKANREQQRTNGRSQTNVKPTPTDVRKTPANNIGLQPSALEMEALEEAFEDMI